MILNGWKEIASYLGRGVRTVQRWEQFGLPVRRPKGSDRSAVLALSEELDAWIKNCATHNCAAETEVTAPVGSVQEVPSAQVGVRNLRDNLQRTTALLASMRIQREEVMARARQLRADLSEARRHLHRGVPLAAMAASAPSGRPSSWAATRPNDPSRHSAA